MPLASTTLKDSVKTPLTCSTRVIIPVPTYGAVPPDADTMQANGLPAVIVGDESQIAVATIGCGPITMLPDPKAVTPLESMTEKDSVKRPFTASVTLKVP